MRFEPDISMLRIRAAILISLMLFLTAGCNSSPHDTGTSPAPAGSPGLSVSPGTGSAGSVPTQSVPASSVPATAPNASEAPKTENKPFRFVVMGDSRGSSKGTNETTLRALMEKVKALSPAPSFMLFTGDQVSGGTDVEGQLNNWKNIVDDYMPMTSIYPTLGNHEHDEKVFTNVFSALPKEQLSGYGKTVYSFDAGNARFITLNSDRKNKSNQYVIDAQQRAWLENELKTNKKPHVFVQFHVPPYPSGAHLGSSLDADPVSRDALWSILDRYRVTAVLVGHEHNYSRRKVDGNFDGNGYSFKNSIYQLTIGGAGAPLYTASKETKQIVVGPKASFHYMVVDVAGSKATFNVYDLQQNEIDSFTVER